MKISGEFEITSEYILLLAAFMQLAAEILPFFS
jgi:hypothetical protein